jgi:hypothetical protein
MPLSHNRYARDPLAGRAAVHVRGGCYGQRDMAARVGARDGPKHDVRWNRRQEWAAHLLT